MPATSQNLYFHLGLRADDDGFVSSPKKITKLVNCGSDDLNVLISGDLLFHLMMESWLLLIGNKITTYRQTDISALFIKNSYLN